MTAKGRTRLHVRGYTYIARAEKGKVSQKDGLEKIE